jgi:hypothetical protein
MEESGQLHVPAALPIGYEAAPWGPRVELDAVEERKISFSWPESNPGLPACSPSLYRWSYPSFQFFLKVVVVDDYDYDDDICNLSSNKY